MKKIKCTFPTFKEQWPQSLGFTKQSQFSLCAGARPMRSLKQGWVSPRCIVSSKHGLLDGGQRGVGSVINWSVGPVWPNGSPLWAGQRRAGGFGPGWWAAHLNRPASGCQGRRPGGYRGRGVCRRAAAPEGPGEQTSTQTITPCKLYTVMTNALNYKSQVSL